ncbi:helix-turn-helix transcriptional regulator [Paracoccus marcusii]|uniref:helix-turn-helix transcriptional regulator n=1 Tax=Paracoccus marcusii TaxID=59779 RepID=UPI001112B8B2|nr:helix-turn-helix transcriptional regulator [Paracoccus marcusii]TNB96492.1 helix-turn-helix transcriptional regulator [Paracoccus marcusii]
MTPEQCKAARALAGMTQQDLAEAAEVAKATIANFETGNRQPYKRTVAALRAALEAQGLEFTASGVQAVI